MNVTEAPLASTPTSAEMQLRARTDAAAADRDGAGARLFVSDLGVAFSDARLAFILADDTYERLVANLFGLPRGSQSFLVKVIVAGSLVSTLKGLVPRLPRIRMSRADTAMGGAVLNAGLGAIAGAQSRTIIGAGLLVGFALVSVRSIRSGLARFSYDIHAAAHVAEARYGHGSPTNVAADRAERS